MFLVLSELDVGSGLHSVICFQGIALVVALINNKLPTIFQIYILPKTESLDFFKHKFSGYKLWCEIKRMKKFSAFGNRLNEDKREVQ